MEGVPGSLVRWTEPTAASEGLCRMCRSFLQRQRLRLPAIVFYICYINPPRLTPPEHVAPLPSTPPPSIMQAHWQPAEGYHARPLNTWFKEWFCPPTCQPHAAAGGLCADPAKTSSVSSAD